MFDSITRSQLIERITDKQDRLQYEDVKLAVQSSFDYMSRVLSLGKRIEVRGFGSFTLHYKKPKTMLNPRTKAVMNVPGRNIPYFKPSSTVNKRLNKTDSGDVVSAEGTDSDDDTDRL